MKWVRFVLAPTLLVALVTTSLYVGLARSGSTRSLTVDVLSAPEVRDDVARLMVDQLVDSGDLLLTALLTTDREKAESAIASSLGDQQEQTEIADAVESVINAMFTGKESVTIDSKPIYRPVYQALDAVFPALKLGQTNLDELDPIVMGSDSPLPDLSRARLVLMLALLLWPLWLLLLFFYVRRNGRPALRNAAKQTLIIASISLSLTIITPVLLRFLVAGPLQKLLISLATAHLAFAALWISLLLLTASAAALLLTRERVVPGEGAAKSE